MSSGNGRLGFRQLVAFSAPAIGLSALATPLGVYLPPFYATEMGLSLTVVGAIFMVARFWDLFTDPVIGMISDRFPSRWGRRRHWMVLAVPIVVPTVVLAFMPGKVLGPETQASQAYLFWVLIVLYVGFTLATISHMSWAAELSTDYDERSRLQGGRELAYLLGMILVLGPPIAIEAMGVEDFVRLRVNAVGWFVIIVLPLATAGAVFAVPERSDTRAVRVRWKTAISALLQNRLMMRVLLADFLVALPSAVRGTLYIFFITLVVQTPEWTSLILVSYFVGAAMGVPVWVRLSRTLSKHRTICLAVTLHIAITLGYLFLGPGDSLPFAAMFFGTGVFMGGTPVLFRAITADITDDDDLRTGEQSAGLYFAMITMTTKIGAAVGIGIAYPWLDAIGFNPVGENPENVINGLRYTFVFFPVIAEIVVVALLYKFPLGRSEQQQLRAELAARDNR